MRYTIDETMDEHGVDRFFVADGNGDWIGEPHDTYESASAQAAQLTEETTHTEFVEVQVPEGKDVDLVVVAIGTDGNAGYGVQVIIDGRVVYP